MIGELMGALLRCGAAGILAMASRNASSDRSGLVSWLDVKGGGWAMCRHLGGAYGTFE